MSLSYGRGRPYKYKYRSKWNPLNYKGPFLILCLLVCFVIWGAFTIGWHYKIMFWLGLAMIGGLMATLFDDG